MAGLNLISGEDEDGEGAIEGLIEVDGVGSMQDMMTSSAVTDTTGAARSESWRIHESFKGDEIFEDKEGASSHAYASYQLPNVLYSSP